jgi:hypothetical protein
MRTHKHGSHSVASDDQCDVNKQRQRVASPPCKPPIFDEGDVLHLAICEALLERDTQPAHTMQLFASR